MPVSCFPFELLHVMILAEMEQGDPMSFYFICYPLNRCPFRGIFSATFFTSLCSLVVSLLFRTASRCSAEALRVPLSAESCGMPQAEPVPPKEVSFQHKGWCYCP